MFSKHPNGLKLPFYVALIATLVLHLPTGRKPRTYAMFWLNCIAASHARPSQPSSR